MSLGPAPGDTVRQGAGACPPAGDLLQLVARTKRDSIRSVNACQGLVAVGLPSYEATVTGASQARPAAVEALKCSDAIPRLRQAIEAAAADRLSSHGLSIAETQAVIERSVFPHSLWSPTSVRARRVHDEAAAAIKPVAVRGVSEGSATSDEADPPAASSTVAAARLAALAEARPRFRGSLAIPPARAVEVLRRAALGSEH